MKRIKLIPSFEGVLIALGVNSTKANTYIYIGLIGAALEIVIKKKVKSPKAIN